MPLLNRKENTQFLTVLRIRIRIIFGNRTRIRNRIRVKNRIRIRIKVKSRIQIRTCRKVKVQELLRLKMKQWRAMHDHIGGVKAQNGA